MAKEKTTKKKKPAVKKSAKKESLKSSIKATKKPAKRVKKEEGPKKESVPKKEIKAVKKNKYFEAVGRRKTSVARVRIFEGGKDIIINFKDSKKYFPTFEMQKIVEAPFEVVKMKNKFEVSVLVSGGGIHSQSEAVRHGIARALVKYDEELRKKLKRVGFLTRDSRMKERRKFGLKKARRAPQWSKR